MPISPCWKSGEWILDSDPYPDQFQNLIDSHLDHITPTHQVSWKLIYNFMSNLVNRQTDK